MIKNIKLFFVRFFNQYIRQRVYTDDFIYGTGVQCKGEGHHRILDRRRKPMSEYSLDGLHRKLNTIPCFWCGSTGLFEKVTVKYPIYKDKWFGGLFRTHDVNYDEIYLHVEPRPVNLFKLKQQIEEEQKPEEKKNTKYIADPKNRVGI